MSTVELTPIFRGAARPVVRAEVELALVAVTSPAGDDAAAPDLPCDCAEAGAGVDDAPARPGVGLTHGVLLVLLSLPLVLFSAVLFAAATR